ncbi:MAG: polysaccharide export protein [Acidobacteria bacterium]|nr:polysaccharide export protein [Acidobacteriota bacterium]
MNKYPGLAGVLIVSVVLAYGADAFAQAPVRPDPGPGPGTVGRTSHQSDEGINTAQNAADNRAWALKSGPGAPHNILPGPADARALFESAFLRMPKLSPEYVLGEGDQLDVVFVGEDVLEGTTKALTIGNDGTINMPYVGAVKSAGLTPGELEETIARLYAEKQLLKNPQVLVHITEFRANPIFVIGQVDNTGEYMMSQQLTVMEAILMAGGLDPGAGSYAYLHRQTRTAQQKLEKPQPSVALAHPTVGGAGVEVIPIDLRPLKFGAVPEPDILLQKGDILVVPASPDRRFYVLGDVSSAGAIVIPPPAERTMLVSQAIAHAGGPTRTAKMSDGMLIRFVNGRWEEKKVDFLAILKGKQQDFPIENNDIIFIPGSNMKAIGYEMLGIAPQALSQGALQGVRK